MTGLADTRAGWLDLCFGIEGGPMPADHRQALAAALEQALPWLASVPDAGIRLVHLVPMAAGGLGLWLLSRRSRLHLRLPAPHLAAAAALQGLQLDVAGNALHVGRLQARELRPWHTLHAHLVATEVADEAGFMQQVDDELSARALPGRAICGRRQQLEGGALQGYSLMVDGLSPAASLWLLEHGLGRQRRLGCGVFDAHRSTAAVGTVPW